MPRFYIDKYQPTSDKRLIPLNGEVFVKCVIEGKVRGKIRRSTEVGKSGHGRLRTRFDFKEQFMNAQMNAMYQFKTRYGASGERIVKVLDYWVNYPGINGYSSKRVKRGGKYYNYVFDEKGKFKTYSRWSYTTKKDIKNYQLG